MNWRKRLAKEWLWFLCPVGVILLILLFGICRDLEKCCPYVFWLVPLIAYVFVCLVRFTIWAIRQVREKE